MSTTTAKIRVSPDIPEQWRLPEGKWYTYQLFIDRSDTPLYVGYTSDLHERLCRHRARKVWWPLVDRIDVEAFDSPAAAKAQESHLIVGEAPMFNVVGNRHAS